MNAEGGGVQKQQQERLQSQVNRLRLQAEAIHERIVQDTKRKYSQFKEVRRAAAREHAERKVLTMTQRARQERTALLFPMTATTWEIS